MATAAEDQKTRLTDEAKKELKTPLAQGLLRQFLNTESGQKGNTRRYQAGYTYTFELSAEQQGAVDADVRGGMSFEDAVDKARRA